MERNSLSKVIFDWGPWLFNLGLVIVGALQVWLLGVTWRTIRIQAQLQRFQLRQWVDVWGWKLRSAATRGDDGGLKEFMSLQYIFFLLNRTEQPVHLKRVFAEVTIGTGKEQFEIDEPSLIPPYQGEAGSAYMCLLPVNLRRREIQLYEDSQLVVQVNGRVFFQDSEGVQEPQEFRRLIKCGPSLEEAFLYVGRNFKPIEHAANPEHE
jgi:hypothetical protein